MIFNTHTLYTLAQAYGCDDYGGAAYAQCSTPTSNPQNGNTSTLQQTTSPGQETTAQPDATNPPQDSTSTGTLQPTTPSEITTKEGGPLAGLGFEWILIGAILLAIIIAWLVLLIKRRRRKAEQPPTTFSGTGFSN